MQVWNVLLTVAANTGRKKVAKNRHLGTIAQLCRAISSQLRHVSTIGKKLVKQQYLLYMSPQYCALRPTSGWDHFVSLGHPYKFQRVWRLGSVTGRHSSSGRQPNFAALNRGRHIYSAGRSSRWALAHILVLPTSVLWKCCFGIKDGWPVDTVALKILMVGLVNVAWLELLEAESCSQCCNVDVLLCFYCLVLLEWCKPWPHVTTCHASIRQLLSSCCYLFTVLSSGLLFYT